MNNLTSVNIYFFNSKTNKNNNTNNTNKNNNNNNNRNINPRNNINNNKNNNSFILLVTYPQTTGLAMKITKQSKAQTQLKS